MLIEAAEFRHYPLLALSVFYICMFWYKSPGHKCNNSLLFWSCCFHSDNLYGPWFVFIMECEFDNIDMEWTPYIEWQHVSGDRTHRSVKWRLYNLTHYFWRCGSKSTACIPSIVYCYAVIIKKIWNLSMINKKYNLRHLCFLKSSVAGIILWFIPAVSQFFHFHFLIVIKMPNCWYILKRSKPVIKTSVFATSLNCAVGTTRSNNDTSFPLIIL